MKTRKLTKKQLVAIFNEKVAMAKELKQFCKSRKDNDSTEVMGELMPYETWNDGYQTLYRVLDRDWFESWNNPYSPYHNELSFNRCFRVITQIEIDCEKYTL